MAQQVLQIPYKLYNPFKITVDFDELIAYAKRLTERKINVDEDNDTRYCGRGYGTDHRVTQEEWDNDTAKFLQDCIDLKEQPAKLESLVADMRRKKDGSFYKGCVSIYSSCDATGWYYEEGYGIRYDAVRIKASGDTTATISICEETDGF